MATFKYAMNETNSENPDGVCTVVYFDGHATETEIRNALRSLKSRPDPLVPLVTDPDDECFSYLERATALSETARWQRYECYGSC